MSVGANPRVSVILPTHDRAALLPRALASVLQQTCREFELIVVDDRSTDGTRELVAGLKDPRVTYVRNDGPDGGDARARNLGAARARGEWLAFQDSDDEWAAHKLAAQLTVADAAPADVALVGSALLRVTPSRVEPIYWPVQETPRSARGDTDTDAAEGDRAAVVGGFCAYLQSVLVRRSAFEALGGFDAALKARSDFELCLRLVTQRRGLATREFLAISYEAGDGISGRPDYRRDDIRYILGKHAPHVQQDRTVHARYWYDLGKAELACGDRAGALRAAWQALRLDPSRPRHWALPAVTPFGAAGLQRLVDWRRRRSSP